MRERHRVTGFPLKFTRRSVLFAVVLTSAFSTLFSLHLWIATTTMINFDIDDIDAANSAGLERLRQWLVEQNDLGRPQAVIYYLTHSRRYNELNASLASLDVNFNDQFHYPVIIFYESSDAAFNETNVASLTRSTVIFQKINFRFPESLRQLNESHFIETGCGTHGQFPMGYRHMCRFNALGVYEQPIMKLPQLEFVLRLDDDSLFLRVIDYDIFEYMRRNAVQYGYVVIDTEFFQCMQGLHAAVDAFLVNNTALRPTFYGDWQKDKIFYTNFELSAMSLWRSAEYRKFIGYIDELGGIYYYRWGDAPIKTIAVSLLVPKKDTRQFDNIGYKHQHRINL